LSKDFKLHEVEDDVKRVEKQMKALQDDNKELKSSIEKKIENLQESQN
jgi:hypothetical protein